MTGAGVLLLVLAVPLIVWELAYALTRGKPSSGRTGR